MRAAGAVVLATLVACGNVKSSPDAGGGDDIDAPQVEDGDFTLTADPGSIDIPIASSRTATVSIQRAGDVGEVMLSASGAGANLTVEFSQNPIPADATSSTVTITANGGMAAASSTLMIVGVAGAKTHTANIAITTTTITVAGTVRGGIPNITVGLVGKPSVTSGANGSFTFTDVTPPYDLYTVSPSGCGSSITTVVHYFDGLTRPDPTVSAATPPAATCIIKPLPCGIAIPCKSATATGTRSGAGNGSDPIVFAFTGGGFNATAISATAYTAGVGLGTADSASGNVYALQLTRKASGAPDSYLGFAKSGTVTFSKDTTTAVNLNAATVNSTFTLSGAVTAPAGYDAPNISLNQEFGTTTRPLWGTNETTTVDAKVPVIAAAGGTNLYVSAIMGAATSYYTHPLAGDTTVDFSMYPAAVITAPADAATGVTVTTPFMWTPAPGTISRLALSSNTPTKVTYYVYTAGSEITIPELTEAALPPGQTFSWSISGYGPYTSVDEAASTNELEDASPSDVQGPAHAYTSSGYRSFTTP
jgi:hypothetical protein